MITYAFIRGWSLLNISCWVIQGVTKLNTTKTMPIQCYMHQEINSPADNKHAPQRAVLSWQSIEYPKFYSSKFAPLLYLQNQSIYWPIHHVSHRSVLVSIPHILAGWEKVNIKNKNFKNIKFLKQQFGLVGSLSPKRQKYARKRESGRYRAPCIVHFLLLLHIFRWLYFSCRKLCRKVWADTALLCIQTAQELKLCITQVPALIPLNCVSHNTISLPEILVSPVKGRRTEQWEWMVRRKLGTSFLAGRRGLCRSDFNKNCQENVANSNS